MIGSKIRNVLVLFFLFSLHLVSQFNTLVIFFKYIFGVRPEVGIGDNSVQGQFVLSQYVTHASFLKQNIYFRPYHNKIIGIFTTVNK
jgi:hypothetical protein